MNLMNKKVKVVSGYYKDIEGVINGVTVDGFWLVTPKSNNGFFAKTKELITIW